MTRQSIRSCWLLLAIVPVVLSGCSKKEDVPAPTPETAQPAEATVKTETPGESAVTLDRALELWGTGQKDQAVRLILEINWSNTDIFTEDSVFRVSEAQFQKMPEKQRLEIQQKALTAARNIKEMSRFMTEQAKQAGATADTYRRALTACGQRLSGDDQLLVIQLTGKAIVSYVKKELDAGN
jgi:hypothetical protein